MRTHNNSVGNPQVEITKKPMLTPRRFSRQEKAIQAQRNHARILEVINELTEKGASWCLAHGAESYDSDGSLLICEHHGCYTSNVHPKYHSITDASTIAERKDFTHFSKWPSNCTSGDYWTMPVNPYDKKSDHDKWNDFEGFRQAHSFKATGKVPADRDVFHRSEVEIVFEEYDS